MTEAEVVEILKESETAWFDADDEQRAAILETVRACGTVPFRMFVQTIGENLEMPADKPPPAEVVAVDRASWDYHDEDAVPLPEAGLVSQRDTLAHLGNLRRKR